MSWFSLTPDASSDDHLGGSTGPIFLQAPDDLFRHFDCRALLPFLGHRSDMRRCDHARVSHERILAGRLLSEHIQRGTRNSSIFKRDEQRVFVDDSPARSADQARTRL